jgi:hypothetical protein
MALKGPKREYNLFEGILAVIGGGKVLYLQCIFLQGITCSPRSVLSPLLIPEYILTRLGKMGAVRDVFLFSMEVTPIARMTGMRR